MNCKLEYQTSEQTAEVASIAVPSGWTATRADENRLMILPEHPHDRTTNGFTANVVATLYPIDQTGEDPLPAVQPLTLSIRTESVQRSSTIALDQIAGGELTQLIDERSRGAMRLSIVCSAASEAWSDVASDFDQIVDQSEIQPSAAQEGRS